MWNPFKIRSYKGMKDIEARDILLLLKKKKLITIMYLYKSNLIVLLVEGTVYG